MRKPSIVVVEASSAMGLLLNDLLTGAGYEVRLWTDSSGAFELIRREHPDLVMLDLSLTRHGDGLPILDQLCRHEATSSIPLIVFADDALVVAMLDAFPGPWHFEVLAMPLYLDLLMRKVHHAVKPPQVTMNATRNNARRFLSVASIAR